MKKKFLFFSAFLIFMLAVLLTISNPADVQAQKKGKAAEKAVEQISGDKCFTCHAEVKELKKSGKHARLDCAACHSNMEAHLKDYSVKPATNLSLDACGKCHKDQYNSFFTQNLKKPARVEKSQLTERSPNPYWDKLMMGHGFTKEHNAPRSHMYMLIDHLIVDRAYGGRFQAKDGWKYVNTQGPAKAWDVLYDKYPQDKTHKAFIPESAAAANPVCLQCKTQDQILKWKFMGDKDVRAKWDRTSNVVEYVKDLQSPLNCIICHDPHAAKPRIVRDGLIQALTRPEADTLWHKDSKKTPVKVIGFRDFRKIAILDKYDAKLQCGQCHVEYNCNPGYDPKTGKPITMANQLTNHFPFKDVFQIYDHYNKAGFRDFKHALTGGLLWKAQHPEAETFWNSKHDKAGVSCNDCHMPKVKNKQGKVYTSHWQTSPRNYIKETCLKCHTDWNAEKAVYAIDSVKNHIKGKLRKAEFWISELIDKIVAGKNAGLAEDILNQAREQHQKAHIYWEWWTAENSDGFHNPDQARESLTKSVVEARKGIEIINKALVQKKGK